MYEQIAVNKRRSVVYVGVFVLAWLGIGAAVGALIAALSTPGAGTRDVLIGVIVAALAALAAVMFTVRSGAGLVLAVAGAHPADPRRYPQLHHLVEALAIGAGMPKPAVYV